MEDIQGKIRKAATQAAVVVLFGLTTAFLVNALRAQGLLLFPEGVSLKGKTARASQFKAYSADESLRLLQEDKAVFLDAREEALYTMGHIPGALHMPREKVEQGLNGLKGLEGRGKVLIAYCDGQGCRKAEDLVKVLQQKGVKALGLFPDGWEVWMDRGYPMDEGSGDGQPSAQNEQ